MTSAEYRQAIEALPYGKRLPGAVYLLDPGDDIPYGPSKEQWASMMAGP